ncbi:phytanoyl-CoA dioxygenase family protein [Thalassobaculum litoreum]|uniref:Chlorinating enzyme n=1 Tax=Thalassobaculum litoreum DSM 18839 TaxID=1123362 RepID=A0A8G2BM98_9PROT|nr:phytanoyl-CoA dioxygenase family protein [Thalassobaculum litoreum]SDG17766.1 chlorinating enzyme [Thalassobaculum litoreum DSM 18839]
MLKTLTAAAIAEYERDGFYFPIPVLGAEEVQRYRSALEAFERDNGGPLRGPMMFKTHLLFRWVDELIRHPKVLDAVEDILGPNLLAWNTHFFIKEPGDERYVAWHQDLTYWNLDPDEALTAWIALSPSTPKSGAMRMVPGTHTREVVPHLDTWKNGAMLTRGQEIAVEVDEDKAIDVTLRPGEMSLHHQKIFHASPANRADDRRIGLAIRYIPTHVRQVVIDDDSAALVRGTDEYGHFQLEPRPERDMDPALVAMQAEAAERQARILYHGTDRPTFRADI